MKSRAWLLVPLLLDSLARGDEQSPPRYADHKELLVWRDTRGATQPVKTPEDWQKRRAHILAGMQEVMGKLPDRAHIPPLDVRVTEDVRSADLVRLKLTFVVDKDTRIPAYLLLPRRTAHERLPAMLALHQTTAAGKGEPVGVAGNSNLAYGLELAKRGYVVLAPDYPTFGDYPWDLRTDSLSSGTMRGIVNHMRAVDLLASRAEVDPARIGAIGHSLGGHNAIFLGAFDERIKVVVSSCGWTPFHDYYSGDLTNWAQDRYMPRVRDSFSRDPNRMPFDFYETIAAIAPRAFFSSSPVADSNFDVTGVRKAEPIVRKVYELLGASDKFRIVYPNIKHDFPLDMREQAYQFIDGVLKRPEHKQASRPTSPSEEIEFAAALKRVPPHEPHAATATIKVAEPFRVEQVAAEPLVTSPVALAFDERERLYVVEMRDYPETPNTHPGRVRLLEDTDADGCWDKATTFVDKLSWPTAIACWDGGVFIGVAPDILYCKDTDGDGRADVRNVVYTGFGRSNVQGLLNSFTWGFDNRIHGATSLSDAELRRPDQPDMKSLTLRRRDFAFDPRSMEIAPTSGGAQHGLTFDEFGNKFVCGNSEHLMAVLFDDRYIARNPLLAAPSARQNVAADGPQAEVYRISPVEAWRVLRTKMRVGGQDGGVLEGGGRPAGYFTSASGITIYGGDAWPDEYQGMAIVGDVGGNLVHRKRLETDGVSWIGHRIDEGKEFLASTDIWFRPVGFANAPDGSLYVMDMYREVIEHPDSLPPTIKKHLTLSSGRDRGRLYRVVPKDFVHPQRKRLAGATTEALVAALEHPNSWHRQTAARLLFERQDRAAAGPLKVLARSSTRAVGRVQALHALQGLDSLEDGTLLAALSDANGRVREHAVRLAEKSARSAEPLRKKLCAMTSDDDVRVRYQLAFSLGELPGPEADDALARLAARDAADPWINLAILSSLGDADAKVFQRLAGDRAFRQNKGGKDLIATLARQIAGSRSQSDLASVWRMADSTAEEEPLVALAIQRGLHEGLARNGKNPNEQLRAATDGASDKLLAKLVHMAREIAANDSTSPADRTVAIDALRLSTFAQSEELLATLLSNNQPQAVQIAALNVIGTYDDPKVTKTILEVWPTLSPSVRSAAAEVLFSRDARLASVLSAIEEERISLNDIEPTRITLLLNHPNAKLREDARKLAARLKLGKRQDVVAAYRGVLEQKGNPTAGKLVFQKACAACHRLEGAGYELGPNLAAMRNRGAETILAAVLDPNREVTPQYVNYLVVTDTGRTLTGMVAAESATSVTLKRGEGATDTVLRGEIDELRNTGLSLMPEGLEKQLDRKTMADLLAYLMNLK